MISLEEIISRILNQRSDLDREKILRMVEEKRESAGRLLTDDGAAHMVANDLGVSVTGSGSFKTTLDIKDLIIGASDVNVAGTVIMAYPTQTFQRRDGAQGRVGRFVIQDQTGSIKIVLWDEKAELLDQRRILSGAVVRVNHGYIRVGLDGRPEVNVGKRGSLIIQSDSEKSSTNLVAGHKKIGEINEKDLFVDIVGMVVSVSTLSTFTRSDSTLGRVARVQMGDETGQIRVVLWDQKAEIVEELNSGAFIKVVNGRIRKGLSGEIEVHTSQSSEITRLKEPPEGIGTPKLVPRTIRDLVPGLMSVDVLAKVVVLGQVRVFQRHTGGEGKVADVTLIDGTGSIRLSFWDDKTEIMEKLVAGDVVLLKGAYTREGLGGYVTLNVGKMGTIVINPEMDETKNLPPYTDACTPIAQLREGFPANVEGEIVETPSARQVTTRDGRELTVVSLRIRDSTGQTSLSLWNEKAERTKNLPLGTRIRLRDAFPRIGYDGDLELSTRSITKIEIFDDSDSNSDTDDKQRFTEGDYYKGEVKLAALAECRIEAACPNCGSEVRELDGRFICNECGKIQEVRTLLIVEADMDADRNKFRAIFTGPEAEKLLEMKEDFVRNLVSQSHDNNAPLESKRERLLGQHLRLEGKILGSSLTKLTVLVSQFERLES
jgi:replication factor A1